MRESDFSEFAGLMDDVAALMNRQPMSTKQSAMMFRALARYTIADVRNALDAHMRDPQRGRFFPMPADIIGQIETATNNRPTADEAWAMSIRAKDEFETVVWTTEMAQAWNVCRPVMMEGDDVGARMAFKAAYDRLVTQAKAEGRPVEWTISEGFDKQRRIAAIQSAQAAGIPLTYQQSEPVLMLETTVENPVGIMPPEIREKLQALREKMRRKDDGGESAADKERERLALLKAEQAAKMAAYMDATPETRLAE